MTSLGSVVCTSSLLLLALCACHTRENRTNGQQGEPPTTLHTYLQRYGDQPGFWILDPEGEGLNRAQVDRQGEDDYFKTHVLKAAGRFDPTKPAVFQNLKEQKVEYSVGPAGHCFNHNSCVRVTLPDADVGSPTNIIPVSEGLFEYRKANPSAR